MMGRSLLWKPPESGGHGRITVLLIAGTLVVALGVLTPGAFALGVPDGGELGDPEEYLGTWPTGGPDHGLEGDEAAGSAIWMVLAATQVASWLP